jgi:hypothetical protein
VLGIDGIPPPPPNRDIRWFRRIRRWLTALSVALLVPPPRLLETGVKRVPAAVGVPGGRISNRRKATDTCAPHFSD